MYRSDADYSTSYSRGITHHISADSVPTSNDMMTPITRGMPNAEGYDHYLPLDDIHIPNLSSLGILGTKPNCFPER